MQIELLGHACVVLTLHSGYSIVIDPYPPGGLRGRLAYEARPLGPDLVLITHEHADHCDTSWLRGDPRCVRADYEEPGLRVVARHAAHDEFGGALRGGHTRIFSVFADGVHVVHAGDLGERLSPDALHDWPAVDALIVPVGGYFTLGPAAALELVNALQPRFVVPCHYQTAAADLLELLPVGRFVRRCRNAGLAVERSERLEVVAQRSGEARVVVLESLGMPGRGRVAPAGG